jgi:hypothetical protein
MPQHEYSGSQLMVSSTYGAFPGSTRPNNAKRIFVSSASWFKLKAHAITVSLAENFEALFPIDVVAM